MQFGDIVVHPAKHDRMVNIGCFRIKHHLDEFLVKAGRMTASDEDVEDENVDDETATLSVSRQAEETTADFVIRRVMERLSGHQFEEFVANLLECMGYTARVTQKSGDGGVDIIAHRDALGFQPPIVKVQCKRTTSQVAGADVNQLLGTLGEGEYGLFICLGSFGRAAVEMDGNRSRLRLLDGEDFVGMVLENHPKPVAPVSFDYPIEECPCAGHRSVVNALVRTRGRLLRDRCKV